MSLRLRALALAGAAALSACGDKVELTVPQLQNDASIRFVNATGTNLDFTTNGQVSPGNGGISFGSTSTCTVVNPTSTTFRVNQAGTQTQVPGLTTNFQAGSRYTVLAYPSATGTQFLTVENAFTPPSGTAGLNVVNLAGGTARYDVYVTAPGSTTLGTASATNLGTGASSAYFSVPSGAQQVRLTSAGSQNVTIDAGNLTFNAGSTRTLVIAPPATGSTTPRYFWVSGC